MGSEDGPGERIVSVTILPSSGENPFLEGRRKEEKRQWHPSSGLLLMVIIPGYPPRDEGRALAGSSRTGSLL